jgi:hypothetical protein
MKKKILKVLSYFIIAISFLCFFSFGVRLAMEGDRMGFLTEPVRAFSNFPRTALYAFKQVKSPERFLKVDEELEQFDRLDFDVHILSSTYQNESWIIELKNLKNDKLVKRWKIDKNEFKKTDRQFSHCAPKTPILLEDSSIVFALESSENLYRLDSKNNVVWHNTKHYLHHSINKSADANLWVCTSQPVAERNAGGELFNYDNPYITKINLETGKTMYHKSVATILKENGLNYLIHGVSNSVSTLHTDPIHLNDIRAVMHDGPYWNKGDLFLSIRNRSAILHYRPDSNKLLRVIRGPFYHQHDVDLYNDTTISFFDNHISGLNTVELSVQSALTHSKTKLNDHSRIMLYHYGNDRFEPYSEAVFKKHGIFTPTQGLHHFLANGSLFVESTDQGVVFIIDKNGKAVLKRYLHQPKKGLVEPPHWVSVIE